MNGSKHATGRQNLSGNSLFIRCWQAISERCYLHGGVETTRTDDFGQLHLSTLALLIGLRERRLDPRVRPVCRSPKQHRTRRNQSPNPTAPFANLHFEFQSAELIQELDVVLQRFGGFTLPNEV